MHAMACKRAEEAWEVNVSRLEKLVALTKDKTAKAAKETELHELLSAGPQMPPAISEDEDEEKDAQREAEGEEGEGEEEEEGEEEIPEEDEVEDEEEDGDDL